MNLKEFNLIIEDKKLLEIKLNRYISNGLIRKQEKDESEIDGHLEKAGHNLKFVKDNLELEYFDWCITGCYYSVYQASLALILAKGYVSKNHDATLCILIKEYYKRGVDEEDLKLINKFFLDYQDLLFYIQSKKQRHEASYSTIYKFDKDDVEKLRVSSVLFVNKIRNLLRGENE